MAKRIYLAGTCDTKFAELDYVRTRLKATGAEILRLTIQTAPRPSSPATGAAPWRSWPSPLRVSLRRATISPG
jgi:uncharacterized protein (UPF0261 family)